MNDEQLHIHPIHDRMVSRTQKEALLGQRGGVYWMTGLSGSGKSTLALAVERRLIETGRMCVALDGDNIRSGINAGLSFSEEDRRENIRRIAEVAKLFCHQGCIVLTSFISPTRSMRTQASEIIGEDDFYEIFIDTPLEVCEARDVKGLYKRARAGEISQFTGIDAPYEPPLKPALHILTEDQHIDDSSQTVLNFVLEHSHIA